MTKKILLFDIDGTLLLTGGAGRVAFEEAFLEIFGIKNVWGDLIPDGKTDPAIVEELSEKSMGRPLQKNEYDSLLKRYLIRFRVEIQRSQRFRLMPGVPELLKRLAGKDNVLVGLATGNFEEPAWLKLERGGIRNFFSFGGFGSDSHLRSEILRIAVTRAEQILREKTEPARIYVIGDTDHDVRAAKKLGLQSIAVTTGSMKAEVFSGVNEPTYLLKDLSDQEAFLKLID